MSYIKPDNLEVIQNFLQDAGPRGKISQEDTGVFAAPIDVSFADGEGDLQNTEASLDNGTMVGASELTKPNTTMAEYLFEHASVVVRRELIRGLLRSKTKRGPKRRYVGFTVC